MRTRRFLASMTVLGLVLAACGTSQGSPSAGASQPDGGTPSDGGTATGGTVRIGWGGSPDSLNPGNGVLAESYTLYPLDV